MEQETRRAGEMEVYPSAAPPQVKDAASAAAAKAAAAATAVKHAAEDTIEKLRAGISIMPEGQSHQPGLEAGMWTKPEYIRDGYVGTGKLQGKVALITGGDSGIGRSVAVHFAREGADVMITYLDEHKDAEETVALVQSEGRKGVALASDVRDHKACADAVSRCISELGRLDILVNNAAVQHVRNSITEVTDEIIANTFETNNLGMFYMAQAAVKHLPSPGGAIINTTSVTAYKGEAQLLDYSATKGGIVAFTRALAVQLTPKGIRVNAVAPGPVWTPIITSTFSRAQQLAVPKMYPIGRWAQPYEIGPSYVFLASEDGSYFSGQVLHPNGGTPVNS